MKRFFAVFLLLCGVHVGADVVPTAPTTASSNFGVNSEQESSVFRPSHLEPLYHRVDAPKNFDFADIYNTTVQIPTPDGVNLNTYVRRASKK